MTCTCHQKNETDVFKHEPSCDLFVQHALRFRDEGIPLLLECVSRLERIGEELARLPVHSDTNHKIANIRHTLLGEAFRLRATARGLFLTGKGRDASSTETTG